MAACASAAASIGDTTDPIRKMYQQQVQMAFMTSTFAKEDEVFRFDTGELSSSSVSVMMRKFEKLSRDFDELTELDIAAPPAKKKAYGMMLGFRPWTFWQILQGTANDMGLNADRSQAQRR